MSKKNKASKYFYLAQAGRVADIYIFGDITSWVWDESDVSSYTLSRQLSGVDADEINVHINSYGGEVAEGLAIYNSLRNHPAKIRTICDGFACSAASVVFMAGDERVMQKSSLLMIHNALTFAMGNSAELRKMANDLETINETIKTAYSEHINIDSAELQKLLDAETWLLPETAVDYGFATGISEMEQSDKAAASVSRTIQQLIVSAQAEPTEPAEPTITEPAEPTEPEQPHAEKSPEADEPEQSVENKALKLFNAIFGGEGTE